MTHEDATEIRQVVEAPTHAFMATSLETGQRSLVLTTSIRMPDRAERMHLGWCIGDALPYFEGGE